MMKKFFCIMMVSLLSASAMAQVNKIPADTRFYLQSVEVRNQKASTHSKRAMAKQKEAKLFVSCKPGADTKAIENQLKEMGARPQGSIGRHIMVSTPVDVVDQIAAIEDVTYISKGPRVNKKTDISRKVTGVDKILDGSEQLPQAFTGKDVVIGIIDGGFDFTHPAFKDADGNLRIKAVYAPGMTPDDDDEPVITLDGTDLGGVVSCDPIDLLATQTDDGNESHGTHCAATASGTHKYNYGGMAPEADIVLCPFAMSNSNEEEDDDADEDQTAEATYNMMHSIMYIRDYAKRQGKPYVVSMSLNNQAGPHDGTSITSSMFEELAKDGANMVLAASNEGGDSCYINYQYAQKDTLHAVVSGNSIVYAFTRQPSDVCFQIGLLDEKNKSELWRSKPMRSGDDSAGLAILFDLGQKQSINIPDEVADDIMNTLSPILSGIMQIKLDKLEDGRATISFQSQKQPEDGIIFTIHIACPEGNIIDVWGDNSTSFHQPEDFNFDDTYNYDYSNSIFTDGTSSISMGDWCTGGSILTVGAWTSKNKFTNVKGETVIDYLFSDLNQYTNFSSYGTDLAGHSHPYISAPGNLIISAVNHSDENYDPKNSEDVAAVDENGYAWASMSGTSMATPTVAGIIALWLQANPNLTYEEIKETVAATATTDEYTQAMPIRYGHGKIDAYKGLLRVLGIDTSIPTLSQHQPQGVTFSMKDSQLSIVGAEEGTPIRIYTTDGRLVASAPLHNGSVSLPAGSPAGVYAVQVGKLGSTLIRK